MGLGVYGPPQVDRILLWAYYNKIPTYPIFYLLKRDCKGLRVVNGVGFRQTLVSSVRL